MHRCHAAHYPARSFDPFPRRARPSVLLTPLSVTFVPEALPSSNPSSKEETRDSTPGTCENCGDSPPKATLRICPLYPHGNVICYSVAHTHDHLSSKAPQASLQASRTASSFVSPALSWDSQDTLVDMSSSLRLLPRGVHRILANSRNSFRVYTPARCFAAGSGLRNSEASAAPPPPPPPPPKAPKEETQALSAGGGTSAPIFLGTSKRLPEYNLSGKVILVTGAARGLGLVQAEALLEAGATVYALDRLEERSPKFKDVQRRATSELGTSLHYRHIDVRNIQGLNSIISKIAEQHGRIDGLLAAAGIQKELSALEYTAEDANTMFAVNLTGCLMTAQATAKAMIATSTPGAIVFIASMSGTIANRGLLCPAYNASKAGVIQLARNLAAEWGEHNIRVNTISPGYIVTEMVEELFQRFPERRNEWPKQNMLGRLSKPEDYRGAAVFLLSDASSFVTATDLRIDGGHTSW